MRHRENPIGGEISKKIAENCSVSQQHCVRQPAAAVMLARRSLRGNGKQRACFASFLLRITVMRKLLDVVHHAVQLPLRIDLVLPPECKPVQTLVAAQVAEYWLDSRNPPAIESSALRRIDPLFHRLGIAQRRRLRFVEDRHLAYQRLVR